MIELRPHQVEIIDAVRESLREGNKRVIIQAPCSTGKTVIAASMLESAMLKNKKAVMLCDRIQLVGQTCKTLDDFGLAGKYSIMMGDHPLYDPNKLIQVCSTQTAMNRKDSLALAADLFIIDECHVLFKSVRDLMLRFNNVVWVGLSATPMSKGLGAPGLFEDLVTTVTPPELMARGWLCKTEYYQGHQINLSGVRSISNPMGGSDYDPKDVERALMSDAILQGDIIKNWKLHAGETKRGIAFSSSIKHSKALVEAMTEEGIRCAHIDGYMKPTERQVLFDAHEAGEIQLLSTAKLLNTGYDAGYIEVLLDLAPTQSKIRFCQTAGRLWRLHPGKEKAIYLDFCGNVRRHGHPEDIWAERLDDGSKKYNEKELVKKEASDKEPIMHTCPRCSSLYKFRKCLACGYELPSDAKIYHDDQILKKAERVSVADQQRFYQELLGYTLDHGYNEGWAAHTFKLKFGKFPKGLEKVAKKPTSEDVLGFIKYKNIRDRHARNTRAA
jgi:superfamily II DNA or RNA helicase